ncbi:MAG: response regulator [Anaerolineae bacterium]|jgi:DNA-binding response OmpR family regulator
MNNQLAMIIEDNEDLAIIFGEALQAAGFETGIIQDGETARMQLETSVPTVVILDLHLPRVSGEDILEQIRTDKRLAETRVIIATADPRMADMLKDRADLVLLKPISFGQLRDLASRLAPRAL